MEAAEHRFRVMASGAHVVVVGATRESHLFAVARAHLEHLERRWSRFLPASDITRLNLAAGRPVHVDADTITLLEAMCEAWRRTGGRFDPTVLPAVVAAGYAASIDDPNRRTVLPDGGLTIAGMDAVEIDHARRVVTVPPQVVIDPGGIGKGLAADLVVALLLDAGAPGALVAVGGDLAMGGAPPGAEGWTIAVERPDPADGHLGTFALSGGGVATSSTRSRRWMAHGRLQHHEIDPSSARPSATDLAAVTVFAAAGWVAEAHATAALLSGRDEVVGYLEEHDVSGIACSPDGTSVATADLSTIALAPGHVAR
jgi:thiamine biosynthesis lipoprotein